MRPRVSTGAGFSKLVPFIPGEHWQDRHHRRAAVALEYEELIVRWCEHRGVQYRHSAGRMFFRRERAYAVWAYFKGILRYCPDWKEQPDGPTWYKANCPEQLLFALERHWLREKQCHHDGASVTGEGSGARPSNPAFDESPSETPRRLGTVPTEEK